jgi:hypothetical protein
MSRFVVEVLVCAAGVLRATQSSTLSPADKCEANKLKTAGKYGFCRLKADAKAIKTGGAVDYSKCDERRR